MQKDLFRGPIGKSRVDRVQGEHAETWIVSRKRLMPDPFRPLNLIRSDQSNFTADQWILMSNLDHCYDQNEVLRYAARLSVEQSRLPTKIRFKPSTVGKFLQDIVNSCQMFFEKNGDFGVLPREDQSLLLNRTMKHVSGMMASFILRASHLYEELTFYETIQHLYGQQCAATGALASTFFDQDMTVAKLTLSMLIFSTLDCAYYMERNPSRFKYLSFIQKVQNQYAELTWKYLIYRYDEKRAVRTFSNIVRCTSAAIESLTIAAEAAQFAVSMNTVIEKTEEVLRI